MDCWLLFLRVDLVIVWVVGRPRPGPPPWWWGSQHWGTMFYNWAEQSVRLQICVCKLPLGEERVYALPPTGLR